MIFCDRIIKDTTYIYDMLSLWPFGSIGSKFPKDPHQPLWVHWVFFKQTTPTNTQKRSVCNHGNGGDQSWKCHEAGLRISTASAFFLIETARESSINPLHFLFQEYIIFYQPRFPWKKGISLPKRYFLGAQVVWGCHFFHPATIHVLSPYLVLLPLEVHRHSEAWCPKVHRS